MPVRPTNDARRLGALLLIGAVAGMGVRYVMERASQRAGTPPRLIDWAQARDLAVRLSRSDEAPIPDRAERHAQYARMVARSEPLLSDYMGVQLPAPISRLHVVDRREWLLANVTSFERLFAPIEALYTESAAGRSALAAVFGDLSGRVIGAQMGVLLGFIAQRVLGQYDLSLLSPDPETRGTLYFVEPNIAGVQRQLGLSDEDFRLWITLHECTHVFQFEAYPWVRPYFSSLLDQFVGQVSDQIGGLGSGLTQLLGRLARGESDGKHWIEQMLTPQQHQVFERMQALMSVVEGYSNHTMDAIGAQLLPSFGQIEHRVQQRQQNRSLIEVVFNRVTGMDLKLAQYQQGEAFVNAVVAARGVAFANRVWERPENLPTMEEIRQPQRWIARLESQA